MFFLLLRSAIPRILTSRLTVYTRLTNNEIKAIIIVNLTVTVITLIFLALLILQNTVKKIRTEKVLVQYIPIA